VWLAGPELIFFYLHDQTSSTAPAKFSQQLAPKAESNVEWLSFFPPLVFWKDLDSWNNIPAPHPCHNVVHLSKLQSSAIICVSLFFFFAGWRPIIYSGEGDKTARGSSLLSVRGGRMCGELAMCH
jgi:hypothetical protein